MARSVEPQQHGDGNVFWRPTLTAPANPAGTPYTLRPPRTPPRAVSRPGADGANIQATAVGLPHTSYSRAVLLSRNPQTPQSPSPEPRASARAFAPFDELPPLGVTPEDWAESFCMISLDSVAKLKEPVAVTVFEATHVFNYATLKKWLIYSGNLKAEAATFKNPVNNLWTPLSDLRRMQLQA